MLNNSTSVVFVPEKQHWRHSMSTRSSITCLHENKTKAAIEKNLSKTYQTVK